MGVKKEIKKYDQWLQKHIDKKHCVKISMSFFGEDENIFGFILAMSEDFLLIQEANDFNFDGYKIITKYDFNSLRYNKYDKACNKIMKAEGILEQNLGIKNKIDLSSWSTILNDLKIEDYHIITRNIEKKKLGFYIGEITRLKKKSLEIHNYDPAGILDKETTAIKLDDLRIISFGDRYSTVFRKYLKQY